MPKIKHLVGIFVAIVAFGAPQQAGAQSQTIITNGPFGIGAKIQCFEIPEENQEASCWVYHEGDQMIQIWNPGGTMPSVSWMAKGTLKEIGVSANGHYALVVTDEGVEVYTLERPKGPGRLAGITTPRLKTRFGVVGLVDASITGNVIWLIFADHMIQRSLDDGDQPVNPCQFKSGCPELKPIFLPVTAKLVTGDGRWTCGSGGPGDPCAPTPPSGGEDPTPAHGPVVPTRTPQGASTEAPPTVQP